MNLIEARKTTATTKLLARTSLLVGMSGTANQLDVFIRAHGVKRGVAFETRYPMFGTLAQLLLDPSVGGEAEVFLLLPWDLVRALDWRGGLGVNIPDHAKLRDEAQSVLQAVARRPQARFTYLPAVVPPILASHADNALLAASLQTTAAAYGGSLLDAKAFSLTTYLATGDPIASASLGAVAEQLVDLVLEPGSGQAKVLAVDLDNTIWAGIVGEDGPANVAAEPEGATYRYFLFQTMLRNLKQRGVLLAAISRNDPDLARAPLTSGRMTLHDDDFVAFRAGYGSKSGFVNEIADELDLGLDSVVFVDDNPVELAEVKATLPQVTCLPFPANEEGLASFFRRLDFLFSRHAATVEDSQRTELYRRRAATRPPPSDSPKAQIVEFLRGLEMVLEIEDRTTGDRLRALQLINKTNQFNLNGVRLTDDELAAVLGSGGRLLTARLDDRTGSHGEIFACVIDAAGVVRSMVMSCRVFQRRVEYAFLGWLARHRDAPAMTFAFRATERNEPFRMFIADPSFRQAGSNYSFDAETYLRAHQSDLELFNIRELRHDD